MLSWRPLRNRRGRPVRTPGRRPAWHRRAVGTVPSRPPRGRAASTSESVDRWRPHRAGTAHGRRGPPHTAPRPPSTSASDRRRRRAGTCPGRGIPQATQRQCLDRARSWVRSTRRVRRRHRARVVRRAVGATRPAVPSSAARWWPVPHAVACRERSATGRPVASSRPWRTGGPCRRTAPSCVSVGRRGRIRPTAACRDPACRVVARARRRPRGGVCSDLYHERSRCVRRNARPGGKRTPKSAAPDPLETIRPAAGQIQSL